MVRNRRMGRRRLETRRDHEMTLVLTVILVAVIIPGLCWVMYDLGYSTGREDTIMRMKERD